MKPGSRAVTCALTALIAMNGCATTPMEGTGGSGSAGAEGPVQGSEVWEALEEARRAEVESALAGMWGVASEVREEGAVLEFTFWAQGGAFTLVSLGRPEWGRGLASGVDRASFSRELREVLSDYTQGAAGLMRLRLRREERRWQADFRLDPEAEFPLEAKTWPIRQAGVRADVLKRLAATGREVASRVWTPAGARVRWQVEVELEDEWVRGLETQPPRSLPGGKSMRAAPETVGTWVNVLAPFTHGMGRRKVRLEWEGEHIAGSGRSRWRVVAAQVVRPPPPTPENREVALEYRAMHEQIQRQWREETRESFLHMGVFTAEQVALWVVGGWVARGLGVVLEAVAPTIARVVMKGGAEAVGWFRALLARARPVEKQAFSRLMAKAETEGLEALTAAERSELKALVARLESRLSMPLSQLGEAKKTLRRDAQSLFYQKFHPELATRLRDAGGRFYDIHHCIPLEYAHLFPLRNINAEWNLVAAARPVHASIGNLWTRLRSAPRAPLAEEVLRVEEIVKKRFGRWFNKRYDESARSVDELAAAERVAMAEIEALIAAMH